MPDLTKRQQVYHDYVKQFPTDGVTVRKIASSFAVSGSFAASMLKALLAKGAVTEDRSRRALVYRAV